MSAAPYAWTLEEYVLRAELADESLREVVVEGSSDRAFIEDFTEGEGVGGVIVLDATYIVVTPEETQAAGFDVGVKGSLLTLAVHLDRSEQFTGNAGIIVVIVDHDFDGLPGGAPAASVLVTDYYSMEGYAMTNRTMDRFVRRVLGREVRPAGAHGVARDDRHGCSGRDVMERLLPAVIEIAAVRRVLRSCTPAVGALESWVDYFRVVEDGRFECRGADLLRTSVENAPGDPDCGGAELDGEREAVAETPRMSARGRDFVRLLHKLLKSPWGRRVSSVNFAVVDEPTLTTWLLSAVPPGDLRHEPMPATLLSRL